MNSNLTTNMGNIIGGRIRQKLAAAIMDNQNSQDLKIINVRAGWQQRYGAMQLVDVVPNQFAIFGGWSSLGGTVGA